MRITENIKLRRPVDEVWRFINDPDKRHDWLTGFHDTAPVPKKAGVHLPALRTTFIINKKAIELREELMASLPESFLKKKIAYKKSLAYTEVSLQEYEGCTLLTLAVNVEFSSRFMKLRWGRQVRRIASESMEQLRLVLDTQSNVAAKRLASLLNQMK